MKEDRNQSKLDFSKTMAPEEFLAKQIDVDAELKRQEDDYLWKWLGYIKEILAQAGEEFDWWFDTSSPYDSQIEVTLKSHKCWPPCVSFRFKDRQLEAFDSNFGGGTSFLDPDDRKHPGDTLRKVLARVLARECEQSKFNYVDGESKEEVYIHIQDHLTCRQPNGWIDRDKLWKLDEYKILSQKWLEAKKDGTGTA